MDRARDACEEFRRPEAPADALARKLRAGDTTAGINEVGIDAIEAFQDAGRRYDHATNTAVPDEQIAADAQPENRCRGVEIA